MAALSVSIRIPRVLYEEAVKRGVDVESRIVELSARELNLDPRVEAQARLELAERLVAEAENLLEKKRDAVQASEKLYRAAEESIKAAAEALEARKKGRWTLRLLDNAAARLAQLVDTRIYDDWDHAYFLHVEGFHEARLGPEQVKRRVRYIVELLELAKRAVGRGAQVTLRALRGQEDRVVVVGERVVGPRGFEPRTSAV